MKEVLVITDNHDLLVASISEDQIIYDKLNYKLSEHDDETHVYKNVGDNQVKVKFYSNEYKNETLVDGYFYSEEDISQKDLSAKLSKILEENNIKFEGIVIDTQKEGDVVE